MRSATGFLTLVLAAATPLTAAAATEAQYADPAYGFSLEPPTLGNGVDAPALQRVVIAGPPVDGFAPTLNVQVRTAAMTRDAYVELSLRQFDAAGFELHSKELTQVSGHPAVLLDYEGKMAGRQLRFLALGVVGPDRVWLATCTAPADAFSRFEAEFRRALATFAITPQDR